MSQTKAQLVSGTTAQDLTVDNINTTSINSAQPSGRRNLIINGAMTVSQRGTSFASTHNTYSLDRFLLEKENNAANFTITQSTTSPDGFSKSLKVDCTAADTSTASNEFVTFRYKIEAQDLQHLSFGTSAAKPLVLSFYVRSNVTGTYAVNCLQRDNSSKLYTRNYTIDSADTWERKTISIPADTSGVINDDNGSGLEIYIPLVMGSTYSSGSQSTTAWETFANSKFAAGHAVNVLSNTSNEWYLTGLQLEVGSTATDFEHRRFGEELALCERYHQRIGAFTGVASNTTTMQGGIDFRVPMRATPSASLVPTTARVTDTSHADYEASSATVTINNSSDLGLRVSISGFSGLTTQRTMVFQPSGTSFSVLHLSAEL